MINNIVLLITAIIATIHILMYRKELNKSQVIEVYLLYFLFSGVGIIGAISSIGHIFYSDQVARMIGWPSGNPFQFEVGLHDGAWALLGFLCLYFRKIWFWTATVIGWSFFLLGAAYGHIREMIISGNYAPYNAGMILPDILVPIILIILLILKFRAKYIKEMSRKAQHDER
jgi:hypothetical protein